MSSTPRIAPVAAPFSEKLQSSLDRLIPSKLPAPQIFLTVARNEALFTDMVDMGLLGPTGMFDRRSLPSATREMIILRTCVATRNEYEYQLHRQTIAQRMGLSPAQIADIRASQVSAQLWNDGERALIALVDELVGSFAVADACYATARRHFDEATLLEITHLVGLYTGVAMLVGLARPRLDEYAKA